MISILGMCTALALHAASGQVNPTNPPAPSMRSLDDINSRLDWVETVIALDVPSAVMVTGAKESYYPGDDGDQQRGLSMPESRFTVGTGASSNCVTDNVTGLMWLKHQFALEMWLTNAISFCENLDGSDGRGGFDDWRLPTFMELVSLLDYSQINPALPPGHPFTGLVPTDQFDLYYLWSSTHSGQRSLPAVPDYIMVDLYQGRTYRAPTFSEPYFWPVRGGSP